MATSQMNNVIQHLRQVVLSRDQAALTNGQLLESFLSCREEAAVAALVRRHGPMVWGVCRRLLDHHDAEDAFQASFLVLVRKAATIVPREMVANWLYGVARQTALKARARVARRKARERQVVQMPERVGADQDLGSELQPMLDQELGRLPDKHRAVIVLCDLEGKTRQEAARQLDLPEGTVASRLMRARAKLAKRLVRQGLVVSAEGLAVGLAQSAASASVPTALASATIRAAIVLAAGQAATTGVVSCTVAALTEGVLKAMLLTKIRVATMLVLAIGVLGASVGVLTHRALADKPAIKAVKEESAKDRTEISGVVTAVDADKNTVTIRSKELVGLKTYDVARDARVYLDDGTGRKIGFREGKLADLVEGAAVTLGLSTDNKAAILYAEGPYLQGVLTKVDAAAHSITVTVADSITKQPVDQTFQVSTHASVAIEDGTNQKGKGKSYKLGDLTAGAAVFLKLSGDQKAVGSIAAQGQSLQGVVKAVDEAKRTITVAVKDGKQDQDRTFETAKDVVVQIDDGSGKKAGNRQGKLAELKPGAVVALRLSLDQKAVLAVQAAGANVHGILKEVDANKGAITVTTGSKGEPSVDKVFDVARDAQIKIDGKDAKLVDLPTEAHVTIRMSLDHKTAIAIQAEGLSIGGVVKRNAGNDNITIGGKGESQTYSVAKDAQVLIDDKPGKLADLIDGTLVKTKLSADKKTILGPIAAAGPSFQGVIKSVDTTNNMITLTIGGKGGVGGEDKTFTMAKDIAVVTGKFSVPLKVADLKAERTVVLQLAIDQKAAVRISILGE